MSDDDTSRFGSKRRPFLQAGAGALAVSVAGCAEDEPEEGQEEEEEEEEETEEEEEEESTPDEVEEEEDVPTGGDFAYGMSQEPAGLNRLSTSSAYSGVILGEILATGTSIDPVTFEVQPNVFTDWTVENVEDEPDVYFDIRDGITFNDGEEFTVDDVIFTYEYMIEAQPGRYANNIDPIVSIEEADNDWDVHMKLERPVGTYDTTQLGLPILPEHRWEDIDPEDFQEYQPTENTYEVDGEEYLGPVGLGPGRVTRYEPDTSVEVVYDRDDYELTDLEWLEEHPNLRAGGPFLDSVRFMIYGSSEALQQAFLAEDAIDAMYGSIQPANIPDVEDKEGARIVTGSDTGYGHYSFNMRNTPLDDTIFRQVMGFLFDHIYWTEQLNRGTEQRGAFVMPPGYEAVRPETEVDAEINEHEATKAFDFLEDQPGVPNFSAIKEYLREGEPIHGEEGTYADGEREYPGSLTGVTADDTEARHEYTWDEVESTDVLDPDMVEEEIRINGETIPEILDRPLEMLMYPPQDSPLSTQMVENFVGQLQSLGIPVERNVMTFNTMLDEVYRDASFDIFPMGWTSLSPFAVSTLQSLFHSDNAHGPDSDHETLLNNPMGYGLEGLPGADDLIDEALTEMDADERNSLARQAVEKIYLDYPTQINSHAIPQWPVNEADFQGYVEGIPSPGDSYVGWQFQNVHLNE